MKELEAKKGKLSSWKLDYLKRLKERFKSDGKGGVVRNE